MHTFSDFRMPTNTNEQAIVQIEPTGEFSSERTKHVVVCAVCWSLNWTENKNVVWFTQRKPHARSRNTLNWERDNTEWKKEKKQKMLKYDEGMGMKEKEIHWNGERRTTTTTTWNVISTFKRRRRRRKKKPFILKFLLLLFVFFYPPHAFFVSFGFSLLECV